MTGIRTQPALGGVARHVDLTDLPSGVGDPHTQYALLAGRVGGQVLSGGTAAANDLTLQANTVGTGAGRIRANSPIEFGAYGATTAAYGFNYTATENFSAAFIGGGLNFSGTITFTFGTFIYESFRGAPTINTGVNPGFAAYTVLQSLPSLRSGSGAGHNPLAALVLNAGPQIYHANTGTRTTSTCAAVNWAPNVTTPVANGQTMNVTTTTGFTNSPRFSTAAGTSISFGTIRGLHAQTPAVALFGSSAGTETMTAYYAVDVDNLGSFGGTAPVAAVRSAITAGTNQFFLLNNGGADTDFGGGALLDCGQIRIHSDNTQLLWGAGLDVGARWDGSRWALNPLVGSDFRVGFATDVTTLDSDSTAWELRVNCQRGIHIGGSGAIGNQWMLIAQNAVSTQVAGEWAGILLTQAGSLTIDHAMTAVYAWVVNATSLASGSGSITGPIATFVVGGMTTSLIGSNETMGARLAGRTQVRHSMQYVPIAPANMTGNVTAWAGLLTGTQNNNGRYWARITCDAATTLHGIDSTAAQDGDTYEITNVGANALTIANQSVTETTAANRIILGAFGGSLGTDETVVVRYDTTTARWRVVGD